jgi:hypothetical protein
MANGLLSVRDKPRLAKAVIVVDDLRLDVLPGLA